ncbi:hypothetical protein PPERSA_12361 [Pseudocohnilembus persalinus]|uniref:NAC-A/B domain-containing protein n=1 Tax=Pseudocohnilembus persalinus TaxID=266149 RepID=A0A0V0R8C4_PSEPJ|nr:hypothetical protein PPERSA_12361 [Pseudocohnilembus persalinus]|eukprot:KRX10740.1 hypothetical protein PPERSA_12361 [Pseudocohnilembus persalinus]
MRRKKKTVSQTSTQDDAKLKSALKKLQVQPFPGVDEVNFFKDDNTILHFAKPDVQFSYQNNTYVVSGKSETKTIKDLLPEIIFQLGPKQKDALTEILKDGAGKVPQGVEKQIKEEKEEDDDEVPDLKENFEEVSKVE